MGKSHGLPFKKKPARTIMNKPGEKMHSDVCGPMSTDSIGGSSSDAYVHIPKLFTQKCDARACKRIFVGYTEESTNYRVFDPKTKKLSIVRNVTFNEEVGTVNTKIDDSNKVVEEIIPPLNARNTSDEENVAGEESNEEWEEAVELEDEQAHSDQTVLRDRARIQIPSRITIENSHTFVGVQIDHDRERKTLRIRQSPYTQKIIEKFGMNNAKTMLATPAILRHEDQRLDMFSVLQTVLLLDDHNYRN
ncbi:hypothetical protein KM043_014458 [Ampulex compressa]|nr:hypothetical protein KM043_014458 [Ampulex compressa]